MLLTTLVQTLDKNKISYALVGGLAVSLHGVVRGTIDIDLIVHINRKHFIDLAKAFKRMGLESRLPVTAEQVFDFREEYIQNRNMIAWSFYSPTSPMDVVDVILTEDLKSKKVKSVKAFGLNIKILDLEDLIKMKTASGRPQDLEDAKALRSLRK